MIEQAAPFIFVFCALVGLFVGVTFTRIDHDFDSGATVITTMGIYKTVIVGDMEITKAFGVPVYKRVDNNHWAIGLKWKTRAN